MKILFIILILFGLSCVSMGKPSGICLRCLTPGDACDTEFSVCPVGTKCLRTGEFTFNCTELPNVGEDCAVTQACAEGYSCNSVTNKCVALYYLGNGEKCNNDFECTSNLNCTSGVCINSIYPKCDDRGDCQSGETCILGSCTTPVDDGQPCTYDSECQLTRTCLDKVCTAPLTVGEGGACFSSLSCDLSSGLLCYEGTCTADILDQPCSLNVTDEDTYCADMSQCMCTGSSNTTGECKATTQVTKSDYKPYYDCLRKSTCPFVSNIIKGSCLYSCTELNPVTTTDQINELCSISSGTSIEIISTITIVSLLISCFITFV